MGKENQHNVNGVVPLLAKDTEPKCDNSSTNKHNLNTTITSIKPAKVKRLTKSKVSSEDSISRLNFSVGPPLDCSTPLTSAKDFPQELSLPSGKVSRVETTSHSPLIPDLCQNSAPVSLPISASNHPSAALSLPAGVLSSASACLQALPKSSTSSAPQKRKQDMLCQRREVMEKLRAGFGLWGRPLNSNVEYPEKRILFLEGNLSTFWLSIETAAKERMQEEIQNMVEELSKVGVRSLVVGNLILARYSDDGRVYRARIVRVVDNTVTVRYIDYGNLEEGLPQSSLYTWDSALEVIPAQAVLCCFSLPGGAEINGELINDKEMFAFREVMAYDFLRIEVKRRLREENHLMLQDSDIDAPELEVSLYSRSGTDIILKLSRHKLLHKYFQGLTNQNSKQQQPIEQRPLLKPPPPLHLNLEEGRPSVEEEGPTTPLPPSLVSRAVDNVIWWFEHKFSDEAVSE